MTDDGEKIVTLPEGGEGGPEDQPPRFLDLEEDIRDVKRAGTAIVMIARGIEGLEAEALGFLGEQIEALGERLEVAFYGAHAASEEEDGPKLVG